MIHQDQHSVAPNITRDQYNLNHRVRALNGVKTAHNAPLVDRQMKEYDGIRIAFPFLAAYVKAVVFSTQSLLQR